MFLKDAGIQLLVKLHEYISLLDWGEWITLGNVSPCYHLVKLILVVAEFIFLFPSSIKTIDHPIICIRCLNPAMTSYLNSYFHFHLLKQLII